MDKLLFIDIETVPDVKKIEFIPDPEAPKNYTKDETIAEYKLKTKQKNIDEMALNLDFAVIRAMGFGFGFEERSSRLLGMATEGELVELFWKYADNYDYHIVGFNIIGFDLPIILRRSLALGVKPPKVIDLKPYNNSIIDLMLRLYHNKPCPRGCGLKWICKMYGINNSLPDLNGSMVKDMDDITLVKYNENDIWLTQELAKKTQGYYW